MALAILEAVQSFSIQHKPEAQLKVRIGIHSGEISYYYSCVSPHINVNYNFSIERYSLQIRALQGR